MQIPSWCFQGTGVGSNVHSSLLHLPPPRRSLVATAPEVDFSAIRCTETNGAHNLVNLPESQSFLGFCCLAIFWKNLDGNYANYGNHEPPRFWPQKKTRNSQLQPFGVLAARVGAEEAKTWSHCRGRGVLTREKEGQEIVNDGVFAPPAMAPRHAKTLVLRLICSIWGKNLDKNPCFFRGALLIWDKTILMGS